MYIRIQDRSEIREHMHLKAETSGWSVLIGKDVDNPDHKVATLETFEDAYKIYDSLYEACWARKGWDFEVAMQEDATPTPTFQCFNTRTMLINANREITMKLEQKLLEKGLCKEASALVGLYDDIQTLFNQLEKVLT